MNSTPLIDTPPRKVLPRRRTGSKDSTNALKTRAASAATAVSLAVGAMLAFAPPAAAYEPGGVSAITPTFSSVDWAIHYRCEYVGWRSGVYVSWTCELEGLGGYRLGGSSGAFYGGSKSSGDLSVRTANQYACTVAHAHSVDGGDGSQRCR